MPLLGGLFGKKPRSARSNHDGLSADYSTTASDIDSPLSSPTHSYVAADKSLPSSPNGGSYLHPDAARDGPGSHYLSFSNSSPTPLSNKLRLPFGRKKSAVAVSSSNTSLTTPTSGSFMTAPRPFNTERLSSSDIPDAIPPDMRHLRPPPSKSAIFAAYADPTNALSTRSLPNEPTPSFSSMHIPPNQPVPVKEKRPSLFSWAKSTASFKASAPGPKPATNHNTPTLQPDASPSFNLKSFRHVRPPSPNASNTSLVVPPARPRGASVNSDSSQRISVAAFREAQARRSTADSPVPSFRSPSPSLPPHAFPQDGQRGRGSPRPQPGTRSSPQKRFKQPSSSSPLGDTSESEDSTTSSSEESENQVGGARGLRRNGTITQRSRPLTGKAKSEMGHGTSYASPSRQNAKLLTTRSQVGHEGVNTQVRQSSYVGDTGTPSMEALPPRSQSSLGIYGNRPRASVSTSALAPSAAAKRASLLVEANSGFKPDSLAVLKQNTRHVRDSSTYSNPPQPAKDSDTSESDSDEDNAPLASLVPPRRPGSAMSSASNTSLRTNNTRGTLPGRMASKPLIDITALTGKKPSVGPYRDDSDGFTGGLLASSHVIVQSPTSINLPSPTSVTSTSPPGLNFVPPNSPPKEVQAYLSLDSKLANAPPQPSRKDMLSERLAKLAKGKEKEVVGDGVGERKSASPPPAPQRSRSVQPEALSTRPTGKQEAGAKPPVVKSTLPVISKSSSPDDDLINVVDDSILRLISRTGNSESEKESEKESSTSSDSESDDVYGEPETTRRRPTVEDKPVEVEVPRQPSPGKSRIAPIPIKQRAPPPAFSVTSRPPIQKPQESSGGTGGLGLNASTSASVGVRPASDGKSFTESSASIPSPGPTRVRSSTLIPSSTSTPSSPPISPSFGPSTSSFAKLNSRKPSSNISSASYANSNGSSTSVGTTSPRLSSANMDRANALKTVAHASGRTTPISGTQQLQPRQRSSTLIPTSGPSQNKVVSAAPAMPVKPFALRRDSPASSTGDSSSGRAPLTPRDGSDIGVSSSKEGKKEEWSSGVSGLGTSSTKGMGRHAKRRSVSFEDDVKDESSRKGKETELADPEARRRERRRVEAKAAIELGNVINGPGPIVSDDEDDLPIHQAMSRMSVANPMMAPMANPMQMQMQMQMPFGGPSGPNAWGGMSGWPQQGGTPQMLSPTPYLAPPPADPNFFAAHQQAMMYAKQAYQMAVAQQAMAAAADEWERNSAIGGSVYGGASNASNMMGPPFGMMGMGGMGGNGWSTGSVMFPNSSRSVYGGGISSSRSEYGGARVGASGANWSSSRSVYDGPSDRLRPSTGGGNRSSGVMRDSSFYPPVPPIPQSHSAASSLGGAQKGRGRTSSQPATPNRGALRNAAPPSSWKAGV